MSVDWTRVGTKAVAAATKHEDVKANLVVEIGNAVGRIFDSNERDPRLDAIRMILGTKPGDTAVIAKALGLATSEEEVAEGDKVKMKGYLPAYEHDGTTPLGTGFKSEEDAVAAGFEPLLGADNSLKGWRKKAPAAIPVASTPTVKVVKRNGDVRKEISLDEYRKNSKDYTVLEFDPVDTSRPVRVRENHIVGR